MSEEIKKEAAPLTDEEISGVSGGTNFTIDDGSITLLTATCQNCGGTFNYFSIHTPPALCYSCQEAEKLQNPSENLNGQCAVL